MMDRVQPFSEYKWLSTNHNININFYGSPLSHQLSHVTTFLPLHQLFTLASGEGLTSRDLRPLGQLVYKSFVIDESQRERNEAALPEEHQEFRACFREVSD